MKDKTSVLVCGALGLICATAAHADVPTPVPGITTYIVLDAEASLTTAGERAGGQTVKRVEDGTGLGLNGSRVGFKGTHDLGDGFSAGFLIEAGFLVDTGNSAQGGRLFGRQGYASLASAQYGELRLGRQYLVGDTVSAIGEPFGGAMVTKTSTVVSGAGFSSLPVWIDAARGDNVFQYLTPNYNGLYAAIQVAPGESVNDSWYGLMSQYKHGAINAGVSYEWNKDRATGNQTNKTFTAAAMYDFGVVRVGGVFQQGRDLSGTSNNGEAGGFKFVLPATSSTPSFLAKKVNGGLGTVEIPIGLATLGFEYLHAGYSDNAGHSTPFNRMGAGITYALQANTFVYSGLSQVVGAMKSSTTQSRIFNLGFRTAF